MINLFHTHKITVIKKIISVGEDIEKLEPMFIAILFYNSQNVKITQVSVNGWMD